MKSFYIRSKLVEDIAAIYPKGHLDAHNVERFEKQFGPIAERPKGVQEEPPTGLAV